RQPATTSFRARPAVLCFAISRMVLIDSCWALAMNEQVLTTITSASSASETSFAPACCSRPIITSLSTRFLGQPRLTKPTRVGAAGTAVADSVAFWSGTDRVFVGMQSIDFNTFAGLLRGCQGGPIAVLVYQNQRGCAC